MKRQIEKKESGQGLIEYLILVCLIAVSAISIVSLVGRNIQQQYNNISMQLRGNHGVALDAATADDYKRRDMSDYHQQQRR